MDNAQKLKSIFSDISTPQELFFDVLERVDKTDEIVDAVVDKVADLKTYVDRELVGKARNEEVNDIKTYFDRKIVSEQQIKEIVASLVPQPEKGDKGDPGQDGKDGTQIANEEVRNKLKQLRGEERLSIFDLKDTESLQRRGMNWSSAGFKVYHDSTISGDGSASNPLSISSLSNSTVDQFNLPPFVYDEINVVYSGDLINYKIYKKNSTTVGYLYYTWNGDGTLSTKTFKNASNVTISSQSYTWSDGILTSKVLSYA